MLIGQSRKSGFTLVELSIVIVIIGLLIGGILVGQSLIDSAKINRLVSDLRQYEIAVVQFHGKFKQYPGDSKYFSPPGNADNDVWDGTICNGALSGVEYYQAWAHLSQAQMLNKNYPAYSPSNECAGGVHSIGDLEGGSITPYTDTSAKAYLNVAGRKNTL